MLLSRLLINPDELSRLAATYQLKAQGISIQSDYLRRTQVRLFYRPFGPNTYVAGYVINAKATYRYFLALGETVTKQVLQTNLVEIGAIWFNRDHSLFRYIYRVPFYIQMLYDAWHTRQPILPGGSCISKIQQQLVLPTTIYQNRITEMV